ncbi:MAG: Hpt domain-containing protein, partial [Candidatus Poribacteria bacterium]
MNSDDIVQDFLEESAELLDQADLDIVTLESSPQDADTLASIFRAFHTVKGSCAFLGFARLEELAHSGENLLGKLRSGHLTLSEDMTDALLTVLDRARAALAAIRSTGAEPPDEYAELIAQLQALHEESDPAQDVANPGVPAQTQDAPEPELEQDVFADEPSADAGLDDFVAEFLADAYRGLDHADHAFVALQQGGGKPDVLGEALEAARDIREACAFMGLVWLGEVALAWEEGLEAVIQKATPVDEATTDVLIDAAAIVGEALAAIGATGVEGHIDSGDTIGALAAIVAAATSVEALVDASQPDALPTDVAPTDVAPAAEAPAAEAASSPRP